MSASVTGSAYADNLSQETRLVAAPITAGYHKGSGVNDGKKGSPQNLVVSHTPNAHRGKRFDGESETFIFDEQNFERHADARQKNFADSGVPSIRPSANRLLTLAHSLSSEGADASEDGTGRGTPLAVFQTRFTRNGRGGPSEIVPALTSPEGGTRADTKPHVFGGGQMVRRLMPVECLRLQGFPDDWLDLTPVLSDSVKYRMIGNAVTVNVAEWLGRRIARCSID